MEAQRLLGQLSDLQCDASRAVMKAMIKAEATKKLLIETRNDQYLLSIKNNNGSKELEIKTFDKIYGSYELPIEKLLDILEAVENKYSSCM